MSLGWKRVGNNGVIVILLLKNHMPRLGREKSHEAAEDFGLDCSSHYIQTNLSKGYVCFAAMPCT